ncbi:hypothetical protein Q5H92_07920 [Hymenobacter sp. M29]|uniref:Uncharacterized protein n=1 Tax=Hymenobacter mellowenesis TaxID=3063995 RepID=A0ABT9A8W9_9BACT|nr:hypothetical protein [Hymenobacter sp. M29]MDO7846278.1 hypothetical protein [Hymenobacter sp. M29]
MTSTRHLQYVAEERHEDDDDELTPVPEDEDRHPEYDDVFNREDEHDALPVVEVFRPVIPFVYELGHRVQPEPGAPARRVIWRGQLRERFTETGWFHRVNVYRLDDGFWDCYREDELQAA